MLAFQLITLIGLTVMTATGMLAASALSWLAWLTVLTLLHIQGADTFLALKDVGFLVSFNATLQPVLLQKSLELRMRCRLCEELRSNMCVVWAGWACCRRRWCRCAANRPTPPCRREIPPAMDRTAR